MKRFIITLLMLPVFAANLYSEEPYEITRIRRIYLDIEDMIRKSSLYEVRFDFNKSDLFLAGFGKYKREFRFFYRFEEGRVTSIAKIIVNSQISGSKFLEDYLFDENGNLIFAYLKKDLDKKEERYYFLDGKIFLIRYDDLLTNKSRVLNKFYSDSIKRAADIQGRASSLVQYLSDLPGEAPFR